MKLPDAVLDWPVRDGFGEITAVHSVGGGCINNGARLITASGESFFLKQNPSAPEDMFALEAEGLQALRVSGGPSVPEVLLVGEDFLLLEDLKPGPPSSSYWADFGRTLAVLHSRESPSFGFEHDNYLGSTPQPNPWMEDGYAFFAEQRLIYQARLAFDSRLLDDRETRRVAALAQRLPELIPEQPASLIHGDLWSGNAVTDSAGRPALIDPAAHYGWAEAELGMTSLFGGFPSRFYEAYDQDRSLQPGWRERLPLYNLYHLLNHLNLFGAGYLGQVRSILSRYD